jgi:hypothetical protein
MVAAAARAIYDEQAAARKVASGKATGRGNKKVVENLPQQKGAARDKAGEAVGVSGKSVDHATVLDFRPRMLLVSL